MIFLLAILVANQIENWIKLSESKNPAERRLAIENLGISRNPEAHPYILKALDDVDVYVRKSAAMYTGLLRIEAGKDKLVKLALKDSDAEVRQSACVAIGYFADPSLTFKIIDAMKDKERMVALAAINTAGLTSCADCVDEIGKLLDSTDIDIKRTAASALVRIKTLEAAKLASTRIPVETDTTTLSELLKVIGEAEYKEGSDILFNYLDSKHPLLKASAAYSLSKFMEPKALIAAREVLKDFSIKEASLIAVSVIAAMGDESDLKLLDTILKKADITLKGAIDFAKMRINSRLKK